MIALLFTISLYYNVSFTKVQVFVGIGFYRFFIVVPVALSHALHSLSRYSDRVCLLNETIILPCPSFKMNYFLFAYENNTSSLLEKNDSSSGRKKRKLPFTHYPMTALL